MYGKQSGDNFHYLRKAKFYLLAFRRYWKLSTESNYFGFSHGNCKPQNRRKIIVCNSYNSHGKTKIIVILTIPMGKHMIIVMFTIPMEKTKIIIILSISMNHNYSVSQFVNDILRYLCMYPYLEQE